MKGPAGTACEGGHSPSHAPVVAAAFAAALAPMVTVPALRRLICEAHGGSAASLHLFVALGMLGGALGAPLLARRADSAGNLLRVAMVLALVDAAVEALSSCSIPTALLYALRPLHGAASMGLLAILFARFGRGATSGLTRAASATIVALAVGPALGGVLAKSGHAVPFRLASLLSLGVLPLLYLARGTMLTALAREGSSEKPSVTHLAVELRSPLAILASQRFAIGGLVATWAILARETFHMSDARVGASFSIFLLAFAATTLVAGRWLAERPAQVTYGGLLLGAAFVGLATLPRALAFPLLFLAGASAALTYVPTLARVAQASNGKTGVSGMALAHAAGATGMVLGPLAGAAFDRLFMQLDGPTRSSAFLCIVGIIHAIATVALNGSGRHAAVSATNEHSRIEGTTETS